MIQASSNKILSILANVAPVFIICVQEFQAFVINVPVNLFETIGFEGGLAT